MKRTIKKVAILGSGVMGSRIACHFAGIGVQTLLLDIVPKGRDEEGMPTMAWVRHHDRYGDTTFIDPWLEKSVGSNKS